MHTGWQSTIVGVVAVGPRRLATEVASRLGCDSPALVDVTLLHLEALDAALALGMPELLADQMRWQEVRLASSQVPFTPDQLDATILEVLTPLLDDADRRRMQQLQRAAAALGESACVADSAVELPPGMSRDYLRSCLAGNRDAAIKIVRDAMLADMDVSAIMLDVLQPAQLELGRLWENGDITIAHEHLTTGITQVALSLLYPRLLLNRTLLGHTVVAASVGSEAHEIGIRMISDLLEQAGWRTQYLGADVPHTDVVERVAQHRADVLAVSATMAGHIRGVRELISMVRADPRCARVRILVGGRPFTINPRLADLVGADGWAPGAREALELCRGWAGDKTGERVGADR